MSPSFVLCINSQRELAKALLGGPATVGLLRLLAERAEGNPFFAEQILRYLQERDLLVQGQDGWQIAHSQEALLLPTDVRAILVARLDQLTREVKQVVQTASVLGREFEIEVLARMLNDDDALFDKVANAEQAAIWTALSEMRYIFRHALLRDAAYNMQLQARRRELHALAMTSLENLYATGVTTRYGELAYHAEAAGLAHKALAFLHKAGDAARDAYENSLAIDYYSRALDIVATGDWEARYDLLLEREALYHLQGKRDKQQNDLAALLDLANGSGDLACQAEAILRRSRYAGAVGEHTSAIAAAQHGVKIALEAGRADQAARGYRQWGWYLMRQSAYDEALPQLQQALDHARTAAMPKLQADSLNSLGALFLEIGEHAAALEHYQQARMLYEQTGNRVGESSTWNNQGAVASDQGKYADAIPHYEQALAIRRQIGNRRGESNTLYNLGAANRALGHYAKARACYQGALTIARQVGDRRGEGLLLNSLGLLASNLGAYATARDSCEKSLTIFQDIGDRKLVTTLHTNLGSFAVDQGRYGEAEQHFQSALELARETGRQHDTAFAVAGMGWAKLGQGQLEEATAFLQQAIATWQALDQPHQLVHAQSGLARVALAQRELTRAMTLAEDILDCLAAHSLAESEEPFGVYLSCVQVLQAAQDPRAAIILEQAYAKLQGRAANIPDTAARQSFLQKIPNHRHLIDAYQKLRASEEDGAGT